MDLPVQLPATEIKQGDWLVIASVKILSPMQLRFRFLNAQLHSSTVSIGDIGDVNKIYGNLGLAYVVLRKDYATGNPGAAGALETLNLSSLGIASRDTTEAIYAEEGSYSWLIANNMKASDSSSVPSSTEINFTLSVTGQVRLELDTV